MKKNVRLEGEKVVLRRISEGDVTQRYLDFLNDKDVTKFLDAGRKKHSIDNLKFYVKEKISKKDCIFLAVIDTESGLHIGNVKIEPIDYDNRKAVIGIMIGDKNFWGKGYGTEAMRTTVKFCFQDLNLNRVTLGVNADNIQAIKAYKKVGFVQEGVLREDVIRDGKKYNWILMGLLRKDFKSIIKLKEVKD